VVGRSRTQGQHHEVLESDKLEPRLISGGMQAELAAEAAEAGTAMVEENGERGVWETWLCACGNSCWQKECVVASCLPQRKDEAFVQAYTGRLTMPGCWCLVKTLVQVVL
jgi:hypothetical protein